MAKTTKKMKSIKPDIKVEESKLQESCGKCQSKEFSIAKNDSQRRYCSKCNNVWAPMTKDQLEVKAVLADNLRLKSENKVLLANINALRDLIPDQIKIPSETKDPAQTNLFE